MGLIRPSDSEIRPEELNIDFYLEATRIDGSKFALDGLETYTIGAFSEGLGYGITSIDIDVKPNLQPIIGITLKDFYGNISMDRTKDFNFRILFDLPYPKFKLYVKGYLGKPVSFLLQVKSVKTTYQPSDGSYEIKAEFVPNIFGFFNDIPYEFLFAIPQLKKDGSTSIIELAKNGQTVVQKVNEVGNKYTNISTVLDILSKDDESIARAFNGGNLKFDSITGDDELKNNGFIDIKFNISKKPDTKNVKDDPNVLRIYGKSIIASINSPTPIDWKLESKGLEPLLNTKESQDLIKKNKEIISANISAINKASTQVAFSTVESQVIDSQTIYSVMTRLAGDCAYILGYIIEGGLKGFNGDPSRETNVDIYGRYYPLEDVTTEVGLNEQKPWNGASTELTYVEDFCKALWEGKREADKVIESFQEQLSPAGSSFTEPKPNVPIKKRLTNAEFNRNNPYSDCLENADQFIVNLIQRSGLMSFGFAGHCGTSIYDQPINTERTNCYEAAQQIRGNTRLQLKTFCEDVLACWNEKGALLVTDFNKPTKNNPSLTYRAYFGNYFSKFKDATFAENDPTKLAATEFSNNGIYYFSPKSLFDKAHSFNAKANNLVSGIDRRNPISSSSPQPYAGPSGNGDILCYVKKDFFGSIFPDSLTGESSDETAPTPGKIDGAFYSFFKFANYCPSSISSGIFVDFEKIANGTKPSINDVFVQIYSASTQPSGVLTPNPEDYCFLLSSYYCSKQDVVCSLNSATPRAYLYYLCKGLLAIVSKDDATLDKELKDRIEKEKQMAIVTNSGGGGGAMEQVVSEPPETYQRDQALIESVYTQFHHISQAWISLAGDESLPTGTDLNIRTDLERKYQSNDKNASFYLNFAFPLVSEQIIKVDIRQAIINTELLASNDQTSVLNMMQNVCNKNNFLLQPIPGGVTDNLDELFTPRPNLNITEAIGNNAISIIWAPTPENRFSNNANQSIYPEKDFFDKLGKFNNDIAAFKYGDPNNVIIKSIKASTDDNKVTSESIAATNAIVNNQNSANKKGFDCSMLAVMQGRSYSISVDMIGNAQMFPTMNIAIDGLPIFTGLYWVTSVQHKLTPNNMETTVEATKMKYDGGENFSIILPVTKSGVGNYFGSTGSGGPIGNFVSGDLNYEFLQLVKDVKLKNTDDINALVKRYATGTTTGNNDFPTWFNSVVYGNAQFSETQIDAASWKACWDTIIPTVWPNYGTAGINFLEFVTLHSIIYNDSGGSYRPNRQSIPNNTDHPGVSYLFDEVGDKPSYNLNKDNLNLTAGDLFNNSEFISAHGSKKYGNDPKVLNSQDSAWKGKEFPKSLFTDIADATQTSSTFINEADFYKFFGRGFIKNLYRSTYKTIVEFIVNYTGNDQTIKKYSDNWKASPYNGNIDIILTRSSNTDWDDLFTSNVILGIAIKNHADLNGNYQYITDLSKTKEELIKAIDNVANRISNFNEQFKSIHKARVYTIIEMLYHGYMPTYGTGGPINALNSAYVTPQSAGEVKCFPVDGTTECCTSIQSGKNLKFMHLGNEKQFFKREVRSITIHITDGWGYKGSAERVVKGVGKCKATIVDPKKEGVGFVRGGIHYALDWTGTVAAGIPENIYSVHGNGWNNHGIGIEVCGLFGVVSQNNNRVVFSNDVVYTIGQASYAGTPNPPICQLDYKYCGYDKFQEMTDVQASAYLGLLQSILNRYPNIKQAVQGQSVWSVWGWDSRPARGSDMRPKKYASAEKGKYGIFSHAASPGGDHVDPAPTPKLIQVLVQLGMRA